MWNLTLLGSILNLLGLLLLVHSFPYILGINRKKGTLEGIVLEPNRSRFKFYFEIYSASTWFILGVTLLIIGNFLQSIQLIESELSTDAIASILNSQVVSALIIALTAAWLGDKYAKRAEEREKQNKRREASAAVTDVLSEWVRSSYMGESNENRWQLQSSYWKNILLLDKELLDMLIKRLANAEDAPDYREIIVQARKILLELPEQDINANELNNWPPLKKESFEPVSCKSAEPIFKNK